MSNCAKADILQEMWLITVPNLRSMKKKETNLLQL